MEIYYFIFFSVIIYFLFFLSKKIVYCINFNYQFKNMKFEKYIKNEKKEYKHEKFNNVIKQKKSRLDKIIECKKL